MEMKYGYGSSDERVAKAHFGLANYTKDAPEYLQKIIKELDSIGKSIVFARERNDEERVKNYLEQVRELVQFDNFWKIDHSWNDPYKRRELSVLAKLEQFLAFANCWGVRFIELPTRGIFLEYSDTEDGNEYIQIISGDHAIKCIETAMESEESGEDDWED